MSKAKTSKKTMMILTGLILVSGLIIFCKFIFGNQILAYTDIGSDTYDQYLMSYQSLIHHMKNGNFSLWDFKNGYGSNLYAMNLYDPFLILIYMTGVLFGAEKIYGILVWLQILRMVLAGLFLSGFLSCFQLMEKSKLIASYMYALCGYLVVWGQHYQFGTVVVLFPLLLWMAEKSLHQWKYCFGLALVCALECASSLYFSYMQLAVLGFYILFRIAWEEKLFCKKGMCLTGRLYGFIVLGIGMGMFSLLPSAFFIFNVSGRMDEKPFMTRILETLSFYPSDYYETLGKRFLSGNLEGINLYSGYLNIYESPNVFLSALFLLTAVQFIVLLCSQRYSWKQRFLLILALASGAFILLIPMGSMIFNGFTYPFSRHTFLCLPFFVWITAEVLNQNWKKRRMNLPILLISAIAVTGAYLENYIEKRNFLPVALGILSMGIVMTLIGSIYFRKKVMRQISYAGLVVVIMISMCGDAYYSYNCQRAILDKAPSPYFDELYDPSIQEALAFIRNHDDSFYRVEKDYTTGINTSCLNGMAQNYNGVSTYNSVMNAGVRKYLQEFWPNLQIIDNNHFSFANAVQDDFQASLSNIKYILSKKTNLYVSGYELWQQCGDIYIHRNLHTDGVGKFYTQAFTTEIYEAVKDTVDKEALLAENVLCDTVPSLMRPGSDIKVYTDKGMYVGSVYDLTALSEGIHMNRVQRDSRISGTAQVDQDGILMLTIPYENGWKAYVDDKEVEIHKVNYGFSGICLEAGSHSIRMEYHCPGFAVGVICSLCCTALLVVIGIYVHRR